MPALALVTGAGGGIGRSAAIRLSQDGFDIACIDKCAELARETAGLISGAGGNATFKELDLTSGDSCRRFISELDQKPYALVNSAGVYWTKRFEDVGSADFEAQFSVNVIAMFSLSQAVIKQMGEGGRIVNISSRAALGGRDNVHYSAAKAAVIGMTRSMALELAARGITVNAIAPGVVNTKMLQARGEALDVLAGEQPVGRLGEAEDIAHAISYFADPRAGFVTGQVLYVDGGRSIGGSNPF